MSSSLCDDYVTYLLWYTVQFVAEVLKHLKPTKELQKEIVAFYRKMSTSSPKAEVDICDRSGNCSVCSASLTGFHVPFCLWA